MTFKIFSVKEGGVKKAIKPSKRPKIKVEYTYTPQDDTALTVYINF